MRVERRNVIDADRDAVWKIVGDPDSYPLFMTGFAAVLIAEFLIPTASADPAPRSRGLTNSRGNRN
jgi:hypothetical protein